MLIEIGKTAAAAAAASIRVCVCSITASSVRSSDIGDRSSTARIRIRSIKIRGCHALIVAVPRGIRDGAIDSSGNTDGAVDTA